MSGGAPAGPRQPAAATPSAPGGAGLAHVHLDRTQEVTSSITGRRVLVNTALEQFAVLPTYGADVLGRAAADWAGLCDRHTAPGGDRKLAADFVGIRPQLDPLFAAGDAADFARRLDTLLQAIKRAAEEAAGRRRRVDGKFVARWRDPSPLRRMRATGRINEAVGLLARHGCLAVPALEILQPVFLSSRNVPPLGDEMYGPAAAAAARLSELARPVLKDKTIEYVQVRIRRLLQVVHGIEEIGDIDENVFRALGGPFNGSRAGTGSVSIGRHTSGLGIALVELVQQAQVVAYAGDEERAARVPPTYRHLRVGSHDGRRRKFLDRDFRWLLEQRPGAARWAEAAAAYVAGKREMLDLKTVLRDADHFLRRLLAVPEVPDDPIDFCRRGGPAPQVLRAALDAWGVSAGREHVFARISREILDAALDRHGRLPDGVPDPRYENPVPLVPLKRRGSRPAQTERSAIPQWLTREIRDLLEADDCAWPRSRTADYFTWTDPSTGETSRVWSPVTTEFFRLRLLLPLRTTQVQLLDSGEGDTRVWEPDESDPTRGVWVANKTRWAPARGEEHRLGFLREVDDPAAGRRFIGLYVSTNKTADRGADLDKRGYMIYWEHPEVIALVGRLLRFQRRYNPTRGPLKRTELHGRWDVASPNVETLLPRHHYLFRDAAHPAYPHHPVTRGRAVAFWHEMLDHIERQYAERGDRRNEDGSPLQLITKRDEHGRPDVAHYDLHSLRVTGLTALAAAGCPIEVLMTLAGHATWVMTLYYVKPSPADIDRELRAARARAAELEGESWEHLAATGALDQFRDITVANSEDGLAQRRELQSALAEVMDYGMCPNGGTMCDVGGPRVSTNRRDGHQHQPVPGGPKNCPACRFLVSGPMYLGGLVARLNAATLEVQEAGARLRAVEGRRRQVIADASAGDQSSPHHRARVGRADAAVDAAEAACVVASEGWMRLHGLIERSRAALHARMRAGDAAADGAGGDAGRNLVVLNGTVDDVRAALERCSDYDLWTRVCEDSEVYEGLDTRTAATRRGMRFDRVLAQGGRGAVFAALTDEERVGVGNAYARWLRTRLGPADVAALLQGTRTLGELGLLEASDDVLGTRVSGLDLRAPALPAGPRLLGAPGAPGAAAAGEEAGAP